MAGSRIKKHANYSSTNVYQNFMGVGPSFLEKSIKKSLPMSKKKIFLR